MYRSIIRSLRYASLLLLVLLAACGNPYRGLQHQQREVASAMRFKPDYSKEVFRCIVDGRFLFRKFHLSGILIFKKLDDGSTRAVFQNEMGFSFFDFRWNAQDSFEVVSIMPQLDKPALVKLLQKDMNLALMKQLNTKSEEVFTRNNEIYHRFTLDKGVAYYITQNGQLTRIENAGKGKVITIEVAQKLTDQSFPGSMFFRHHKAHFTIDLKRIITDHAE